MARLLRRRGISSQAAARAFLRPHLPDRFELPNLSLAVERLARAIDDGELITVYGDYDADGITATALLVEGIAALGGSVQPYIPSRFDEGYGLHKNALRALADQGTRVVVAVDTGTSAIEQVAYANERDLDVIVLDHHTPKADLPDAVALVNPHLPGTPDELRYLSGCGVAFAVLLALAEHLGQDLDVDQYLDLVAISTVCDVVPLVGVNRALVLGGLRQIDYRLRPGLAALLERARFHGRPSGQTLGFVIGPRLNAAGRLDHGLKAYDLLTTRDPARARALAAELEELNRRRQVLTAEAVERCRALVREECDGACLVMVGHAELQPGIVGLVAARLAGEHLRPAIVYHRGAEFCTGSARSVDGFDIHEALSQAAPLLVRFGGHRQAGGFTVRSERVEELRHLLTEWTAAQRNWDEVVAALDIDLELRPGGILGLHQVLSIVSQLEPCGTENQEPVFVTYGARVRDAQLTADGRHLRLRIDAGPGRRPWPAIAFGFGAHRPRAGGQIDIAYQVSEDRYGEPQLKVLDFAPADQR